MFFSTNRGDNSKRAQLIQIYKQGRQLSYNVLMYKQENVPTTSLLILYKQRR